MTITMVSNYFNHHQLPLANAIYEAIGASYCFIQTSPMEEERVKMGWNDGLEKVSYLLTWDQCEEECRQRILTSDIVIFGGIDEEWYLKERLEAGKIILRYAERFYKDGVWKAISPRGLRQKYLDHTKYRKKLVYLLCAGGYVAYDYSIVRAYPNKMLRFGYFPECREYDLDHLMEGKQADRLQLLWAGRFLDWKHPELVIQVAKSLKKQGVVFHINVIGGGELEDMLLKAVKQEDLEDVVTMRGYQSPTVVRTYMEKANIFLFTSDFREGWGAVLNEAMNSGCAVVANHGIGAVPFLMKHNENGLIYENGNTKELLGHVKSLSENRELIERLGRKGYQTIATEWNEREVAKRLLCLCEKLLECDMICEESGPLSRAPIIKERRMYRYLTDQK